MKLQAAKNNSLELSQAEKDAFKHAENVGEESFIVDLKFAGDCSFKTIRAGMVLDRIAEVAKVVKTTPSTEEFDEQKLSQGFKIAVTSKFDEKTIAQCAKQVLEVESVNVTSLNEPVSAPQISPSPKDEPVRHP